MKYKLLGIIRRLTAFLMILPAFGLVPLEAVFYTIRWIIFATEWDNPIYIKIMRWGGII